MRHLQVRDGTTQPGKATVTLEKDETTLEGDPAEVCTNCGEEYVDDKTTARLLKTAEEAVRAGVQVDVRFFEAAFRDEANATAERAVA